MTKFSKKVKSILFVSSFLLLASTLMSQQLPYAELPEYPASFSEQNVVARMIDGLGYRYYWATEGLTEKDLSHRPSEDARTAEETIDHIYGLCQAIQNAAKNQPNKPIDVASMSFEEKRAKTLQSLREASDLFKSEKIKLDEANIIFKRGENTSTFPFWNLLNGQLADAIYHVGQIVSFRRSSGNPMNSKVNVFLGKNRE